MTILSDLLVENRQAEHDLFMQIKRDLHELMNLRGMIDEQDGA